MNAKHKKQGDNKQRSVGKEKTIPVAGSEAGDRGGAASQQSGWSSRQQGERTQARGEEARKGEAQRSGYGGAEQNQHAGSQESPTGPPGSRQGGSESGQ